MTDTDSEIAASADGPDQAEERRYRAPALEKGLDVLELLASHGAPMTPSQISAALDRSMSELFRMIQVLEYKGYIVPAETGEGYELSNKLFTLGMARAPIRSLLEAALPLMRELSRAVRQSCHLAVASNEQMVVVARVENEGYLGFSVRPGYRRSLVEATSGGVLFAFQPPEVRKTWAANLKATGTPGRVLNEFILRTDAIRARGYEVAHSDFVRGVTDLSAPVMGANGAIAALTIPFVESFPPPATMEATIDLLRAAAERLTANLAASP
jgi:DNA-binding IclR family transcriptional regulator